MRDVSRYGKKRSLGVVVGVGASFRWFVALSTATWLFSVALTSPCFGVLILPDPSSTVGGLPAAVQYDQAYSYSVALLRLWQAEPQNFLPKEDYGDYDTEAKYGTRTVPILVGTGPPGQDNDGLVESPLETPNVDPNQEASFDEWWGQGDRDNIAATSDFVAQETRFTTVGDLRTALGTNSPVFVFDFNETQKVGNAYMEAAGEVFIVDQQYWDPSDPNATATAPINAPRERTWAFDDETNGDFDEDALIPIYDTIPATPPVPSYFPNDQPLDSNVGGGFADFFIVPIDMDLSLYDDNDLFVVRVIFDRIDDGPEEVGLRAARIIPEPSTFIIWSLLGALVVAVGWWRRRGTR